MIYYQMSADKKLTSRHRMLYEEFVETKEAAQLLHRAEQTLRRWASEGSGSLQPIRVNGARSRLLWRVTDIEVTVYPTP